MPMQNAIFGNKSINMKTISPLNPADLPLAWEIEKLSHSFPWSEETFYSNQGDHYFNLKICIDNIMVGFAITQLILDEATLLISRYILIIKVKAMEKHCY